MSAKKKPDEKFARIAFYAPPAALRWIQGTRGDGTVSERVLALVLMGRAHEAQEKRRKA